MKFGLTAALAAVSGCFASLAQAGTGWVVSYAPAPAVSGDSDATGAVILLLLVGAVILMNNGTTTRNTQQTDRDQNDDDVIMKF